MSVYFERGWGRLWLGQFARSIYFSLATGLMQQVTSQLSFSRAASFFIYFLFFCFFFCNERLDTTTICPSHRAKPGIVSTRSCSTRGRVPGHGKEKEVAKKWKRTGEKRIWSYLTPDWFACKSWIRWILYSVVVYPNISQVSDGSLTASLRHH